MNRIISFFVLVATIGVVTASAQTFTGADSLYLEQFRGVTHDQAVGKVWLKVCELNRETYPDSNRIMPGDVIEMPCNRGYVALNGANSHMWQASEYFVTKVVEPYLSGYGMTERGTYRSPGNVSTPVDIGWIALFLMAIAILIAWLVGKYLKLRRPFAMTVPSFTGASDAQTHTAAAQALRGAFGRGFEIIGPVERGVINGKQTVFFKGGHHADDTFHNEPGYRARLRFEDGTEAWVVSRWSCFNPVWSADGARFRGTFTPHGARPVEIPTISRAQAAHLGGAINEVANERTPVVPASAFIPAREPMAPPTPEPSPAAPETPTSEEPKDDGKLKLTKVQFSTDKGLNLEGDIPMSIEELKSLITQVQTKGESAPKKES